MTQALFRWLDNARRAQGVAQDDERVDWRRIWPFIALHVAAFWALWQGASTAALVACATSYLIRMFGITAFYHRGLSHKAFKMSRPVQFIGALLGTTATQRGPLWWAAHHRHHHQHADTDLDAHSPRHGFLRSHCGWFLSRKGFHAPQGRVKDLERFPELVWLDRFDLVVVIAYGLFWAGLGALLAWLAPSLGTSALEMFLWGYVVSTVLLIHATLAINSLAHRFGSRRYETRDDSRNNFWLALLTLGEGWHNNHHHYAASARQGFRWWEVDITWYLLLGMEKLGWVRDLRPVPAHKLDPAGQRPVQASSEQTTQVMSRLGDHA